MKKLLLLFGIFLVDKIIIFFVDDIYMELNKVVFSFDVSLLYIILTRLILLVILSLFIVFKFGVVKKILYSILSLIFIAELGLLGYSTISTSNVLINCLGETIEVDGKNCIVQIDNSISFRRISFGYVENYKLHTTRKIIYDTDSGTINNLNEEDYYENYYQKVVFEGEFEKITTYCDKEYIYHYYPSEYSDEIYYKEIIIYDYNEYSKPIIEYLVNYFEYDSFILDYEKMPMKEKIEFFISYLKGDGGDINEKD